MIRVVLPPQLKALAGVRGEVTVEVGPGDVSQRALLDALERDYPQLAGTIRDRDTALRRPMIRFFACEEDHSDDPPDAALPEPVVAGREPFLVIGAMSGG